MSYTLHRLFLSFLESLKFQGEQRLQLFSVYCACLAQAITYHSFELFKLIITL